MFELALDSVASADDVQNGENLVCEIWKSRDVQTCFGLCRLGGVLEIHNHVMLKSPLDSVALAAGSMFPITFHPICSGLSCPDGMLDVYNHVPTLRLRDTLARQNSGFSCACFGSWL